MSKNKQQYFKKTKQKRIIRSVLTFYFKSLRINCVDAVEIVVQVVVIIVAAK